MKNISISTVFLFVLGLISCTYDYEMPDYSNATPRYIINELPTKIKNEWRQIATGYGLDLSISQEKWETIVTEKNAKGDTIYQGIYGNHKVDKKVTNIEVSFVCLGRFSENDWNYYEICRFNMQSKYELKISPNQCVVEINESTSYTVERPPTSEQVFKYSITYGSDITKILFDILNSIGYDISETKIAAIEKDKDGNILLRKYLRFYDEFNISKKGAQTVEIEIELYGWPKGNYNEKLIGTLKFDEPLLLKDINNKKIILTADMPHTFIDNEEERTYIYNIDYGSAIIKLMLDKLNSIGYEMYGVEMVITEIDKDENILYQGYRPRNRTIYSAKKAYAVKVEFELYGWPKGNHNDKFLIGTLKFDEPLLLKDINNKETILTADMPYTFIDNDEELIYIYNINFDNSIGSIFDNILDSRGYNISNIKTAVIQKNIEGNILYQGYITRDRVFYSSKGAQTIEVQFELYGWPKGDYNVNKHICTIKFESPLLLKNINNKKTILTANMPHTIIMHI